MAWNEITFRGVTFSDDVILEGNTVRQLDLAGDELAIDTLTVTIAVQESQEILFIPYGSDGLITADGDQFMASSGVDFSPVDAYGEPVDYYRDGTFAGHYYCQSVTRIGPRAYRLDCVSIVGMMANKRHMGGIYRNVPFTDMLDDLFAGMAMEAYAIDPLLENVPCSNWLPIASVRENLHQVLFAIGASLFRDSNGEIVFKFASSYANPQLVPENRLMLGGSLSYLQPASTVKLTEHAFYALNTDTLKTLFDNTDGSGAASSQLVQFDGPYHDLTASAGLTIEDSGVNYAVVSGTGTLTGLQYTHTQKVLTKSVPGASVIKEVAIEDATMVNALCSQNALLRLFNYYSAAKEVGYDLVVQEEYPGLQVSFTDPFGDAGSGFIKSMDAAFSHTHKAKSVIVTNITAGPFGNNFANRTLLTAAGTWIVPAGVTSIRAVIIGGGQGGWSGEYGTDGGRGQGVFDPNPGQGGTKGNGGSGGQGGTAGKVLVVDLTVTPGASFSVSIGAGGAGGVASPSGTVGGAGGNDSSFGAYSSSAGSSPDSGVVDLQDGTVYALAGAVGLNGNDGTDENSEPAPIEWQGVEYANGPKGADVYDAGNYDFRGGYGGGAAVGNDGGAGADGSGSSLGSDGGAGGAGIAGLPGISYGSGGSGGHGGGGGGAGGYRKDLAGSSYAGGDGGTGGAGGNGGDGANGCVVIYY